MQSYGVREVEKLLRLPRSTIRSLVDAGFVSPARGPRNAWLFSFQDLVVLRTARTLTEASVPAKRITRSIRELKRQLPDAMPLSGLAICAVGDRVVVRDGTARWQADSGQYLLALESDGAGSITLVESPAAGSAPSVESLFAQACALEDADPEQALRLYEASISADPSFVDARINYGRLLQQLGRFDDAELVYLDAIGAGLVEPLLHFNLGVLLEERGRKVEALDAYQQALTLDPRHLDALHNAALIADDIGSPQEALRLMAQYRRLSVQSK